MKLINPTHKNITALLILLCSVPPCFLAQTSIHTAASAASVYSEGNMSEANAQYGALLSLEPENKEFQYYYAVTCTADYSLRQEGIDRLNELKGLSGDLIVLNAERLFFLALAYQHKEEFDVAVDFYRSAIGKSGKNDVWVEEAKFRLDQCKAVFDLPTPSVKLTFLSQSPVNLESYFRSIPTGNSHLRLILVPSELRTKLDKKRGWVSPVAFDSEADVLYFSSYGKKGGTGLDIYSSKILLDGSLDTPFRLPDSINSPADDINPVFVKENSTLIFASNRSASLGGFDLFSSETISYGGPFLSAEALPRVWNTASNEYFLFPKNDANLDSELFNGWLLSDRSGEFSAPILYEVAAVSERAEEEPETIAEVAEVAEVVEPIINVVEETDSDSPKDSTIEAVSVPISVSQISNLSIQVGVFSTAPDLSLLPQGVDYFTKTLPNGLVKLFVGPFEDVVARSDAKSQLISFGLTDVFNVSETPPAEASESIVEASVPRSSGNALSGVMYGVQIAAFSGEPDDLTKEIAGGELFSEQLTNGVKRWYAAVYRDLKSTQAELPELISRGARSDAFMVKLVDGIRVSIVHSSPTPSASQPVDESVVYRVRIASFEKSVSAIDAAALLHLGSLVTVRSVELGGEKIYYSSKSNLTEAEKALRLAKKEGFIKAVIEKIHE